MIVYNVFADEILDQFEALIEEIKEEMDTTEGLDAYINGDRDEFIQLRHQELLEMVAYKIREQYAYANTLSEKAADNQQNLYFYSEMYDQLVTNVIRLISVRGEDISSSQPLIDILNLIRTQLDDLKDVPTLTNLRNYISGRQSEFLDKPFFQALFNTLLSAQQGIYVVNPPKTLELYENGTVLASVEGVSITSAETTALPPGTSLNAETGALEVADATALVAGFYLLGITTTVEGGSPSVDALIVPIGQEANANYTLAEPQTAESYTNGFELATVSTNDGTAIIQAILMNGALPPGAILNAADGTISVENADLLVPGTYYTLIRTTDALSRVVDHSNPIIILNNLRATYSVNEAKPIESYLNDDVLATPIEEGLTFTNVDVSELPVGMGLNPTTGEITVTDATALVPGTYEFVIKTTEDNGFIVQSIVAITIGQAADTKATYTVNAPKTSVSAYNTFDILAYPQDADGSIVAAQFVNGIIPPGCALNKNTGEIVVLDPKNLIAGAYTATVLTRDIKGGTSELTFTIPISEEVRYNISRPHNVDSYELNEIVAYPIDPQGAVLLASVTTGTLPAGLELLSNGNIRVADPADLVAGTYTFTVTTTNELDIAKVSELTLEFIQDQEATYTLTQPKISDAYADGELLVSFSDPDGKIVKAEILKGNLPAGTQLDEVSGNITVSDHLKISAGIFSNIQIQTTDITGGKTLHTFTLEIFPDIPAVYVVFDAKSINQYVDNENLAVVTDGNAPIKSARILEGSLPPGVGMDTSTGNITVVDASRLKAGSYSLKIETRDELGGISVNNIKIVLKATDQQAVYVVSPAKNIDSYINGYVLASPVDPDGAIISAVVVTGIIPPGATLDSSTGAIAVSDASQLVASTYVAEIITTDINQQTTTHSVQISILADNEAQYTLIPTKKYDLYNNGEYIATVTDADGDIVVAELLEGTLPNGISLITNATVSGQIKNELNLNFFPPVGYIMVTNNDVLSQVEAIVEIRTTDVTGGKSVNTISIAIPADSEAVYTVPKARMKYAYRNGDVLASVVDADGPIVSANLTLGNLPAGTTLNTTSGLITVTDRTQLTSGSYTVGVTTSDSTNGQTANVFTIVIKDIPVIKEYVGGVCERLLDVEQKFFERLGNEQVINRAILNFAKVLEGKICGEFQNGNGEVPWVNGNNDNIIKQDKLAILEPLNSAILTKKAEIASLSEGPAKENAKKDMLYFTDLYNEIVVNMIQLTGMRNSDLPPQSTHPIKQLYAAVKTQMNTMTDLAELNHLRQNIAGFSYSGKSQLNASIASLLTA